MNPFLIIGLAALYFVVCAVVAAAMLSSQLSRAEEARQDKEVH